jgi:hypothetical protein
MVAAGAQLRDSLASIIHARKRVALGNQLSRECGKGCSLNQL